MASVRQHAEGGTWYACITLPNGKQRQFSTGSKDKIQAQAIAVAAEAATALSHSKASKLREALDRVVRDYVPPEELEPGPWLIRWAESRKGECAPATHEAYATVAREAAAWLETKGIKTFSAFTSARVIELRNHWTEKNSASTANGKLKVLRIALKVAASASGGKLLDDNPAEGILKLRSKQTHRREFRADEIAAVAKVISGEWRGMFHLGLNTGQRLNDLAVLKWSAVDLKAKTIAFRAKKTDHVVNLPLLPNSVAALKALNPGNPNEPIFPELSKLKESARSNQFRTILHSVGLAEKVRHHRKTDDSPRQTSELSFHSLRHTTTTLLKSAGVSDSIARAIVGHNSVAVSNVYTHIDMKTMQDALEKMPEVE